MKAVMIMFDSLNKDLLEAYGCDWTKTPNFKRLAEKTVRFEKSYAGSLPCMPARRELHTGRYNMLHRSWGPIEPFDDSMPDILRQNGVHTHLISDHYHYWEDGGSTYHGRYSTWEFIRGQEGDPWKAFLHEPAHPAEFVGRKDGNFRQDWVNRQYTSQEQKHPMVESVRCAEEFLANNHDCDNWFLHLECFDPHEPFFSPERYKELYPHGYDGPHFDWPPYRQITEDDGPDAKEHIRCQYAALLSMCDTYLGKLLDLLDKYSLWDDTMVIVNTDHGFMLGEHEWWGKNVCPTYDEIANTPLFIWDPRTKLANESRNALVQTIDLAPTLYSYFGVDIPKDVLGHDLAPVIQGDSKVRDCALYGIHGANINCTDGRYVYMKAPDPNNEELYNYTLMCTHLRQLFMLEEIQSAQLAGPFDFTKEAKVLKIKKGSPKYQSKQRNFGDMLFDLETDPDMNQPIHDTEVEARMQRLMVQVMEENDTPDEVYVRYELDGVREEMRNVNYA